MKRKSMRKTVTLITTAVLTGLMLSSCQPTPAEGQVVGKDTLDIEQAGTNEAEEINTALLDIPDTYEGELIYADGALKVQIHAEVVKPDTTSIPVAKLVQKDVDNAMKDIWFNALSEGNPLYYVRSEEEYSKAELEETLLTLKSGTNSDLHAIDPAAYQEMIAGDVSRLEALYATAPETPNLREYDKDSTDPIDLEVDLGKRKPASVQLFTRLPYGFYLGFMNFDTRPPDGLVIDIDTPDALKPSMSPEKAHEIAKQYIDGMGLTDFDVNNVGLIPDCDKWEEEKAQGKIINYIYEELPKCYVFYFTKTIGGLNETYANPRFRNLGDEQIYGSVWMPECVAVTVSDTGVQTIAYDNPPSNAEIIESNVKIISFDEVIDRFSEQIEVSGIWGFEDANITERRIGIDKIELGGMRIISKDNPEEYLYVPVWSFFGSVTEVWAEGAVDPSQLGENNEYIMDDLAQCILTINAIDGSVINRSLGY